MFGDTEDGAWYAELIADQTPITSIRNKLLFGRDFALKKSSLVDGSKLLGFIQ